MPKPSSNIIWLTGSRVFALVLLFFAYTQLFRYLGPFSSGQHQFILSFTTVFGIIIDFGIQQYVIKKIAEEPTKVRYYFHAFFAAEVFLSALVYAGMVVVAYSQNYDPIVFKGILISGLGVAITGLTQPYLAVMSSFQDLKRVAIINFISSLINVTFIFLTVFLNQSVVFLVGNQVVFSIVSFILYNKFVRTYIGKPSLFEAISHLRGDTVKLMLKNALPFALLVGFSTVYNRIDVLLISKILGYEQTGLYTAAYKFFDLVAFFPAVVSHALYPVFSSLVAQKDLLSAREIMEKYLRFMFVIAIPMGVGGSLLAHHVIAIIAGPQFKESAPVLAVLIWAPVALFLYIVANSVVISQLTRYAVTVTGLNVVINVVGNIILLPRYGIIAAATLTVISEFVQGIFYFYFVKKKITNYSVFKYLWKPALASIGMGIVLFPIRNADFFFALGIGSAIYVFILVILKFFQKDDLQFVKSLVFRNK